MAIRISRALRVVLLALAAGLGLVSTAPAAASPILIRDGNGGSVFGTAGSEILTIGVNTGSGLTQARVRAGAFYLQYATGNAPHAWTDFITYCLEPDELLAVSGIVRGDRQTALAQTTGYARQAAAIGGLYGTWFADSLTSAAKTAAFQVALWELAFDSGQDLGRGLFQLLGTDAVTRAVRVQANAYLTDWSIAASPGVAVRNGSQDLLMAPAAIPEPAAAMLFGVGLLALGGIAVRRWRRA